MGLVLDEPKAMDEKMEAEGFFFTMISDVAHIIRTQGSLVIDYKNTFWNKGFQLSLSGIGMC